MLACPILFLKISKTKQKLGMVFLSLNLDYI